MRRVVIHVHGAVQGVGYRFSARAAAQQIGVSGWVRNRSDGSVEGEIEGIPERVDEMVAWMRRGPASAQVSAVDLVEVVPLGSSGFDVLPTR
ncbi:MULTISPECIES: acylphosphatase [unclassified Microbacterium]|uniref:acylphosphatase n=1 Tax=unclassified Microbacterium TaxID=2609290 RepID=UPI0037460F53